MTTQHTGSVCRIFVSIATATLVLLSPVVAHAAERPVGIPASAKGPYPVVSVIDGDTMWLRIGPTRTKVRLIGIDTPETVDPRKPIGCFGPQASARAKAILTGQSVFLEYDKSQGRVDKYGRTLGYIWLQDGQLFQATMLTDGYGREYTYSKPYTHQQTLKAAQAAAQAAGAGLWTACPN